MPAISDSSAVLDDARVLSQHQAALTVLKVKILAADTAPKRWLDLACGQGQIIRHLADSFSEPDRKRLHFMDMTLPRISRV